MTRTLSAILLLCLTPAAFGQERVLEAASARVVTPEDGVVDMGPGVCLEEQAAKAVAKTLAGQRAERDFWKDEALKPAPFPLLPVLITGGVAALLGFGAGLLLLKR